MTVDPAPVIPLALALTVVLVVAGGFLVITWTVLVRLYERTHQGLSKPDRARLLRLTWKLPVAVLMSVVLGVVGHPAAPRLVETLMSG